MNFPSDMELDVDTLLLDQSYASMMESIDEIYDYASENNPTAMQAKLQYAVSDV